MKIIEIQEWIEDNKNDLSRARHELKYWRDRLGKGETKEEERFFREEIIRCKIEILRYQKEDYKLKGQIRNIELQEMTEELNEQLANKLITQEEYDFKSNKLRKYIAIQELYTNIKMSECDVKTQDNISRKNGLDEQGKKRFREEYELKSEETNNKKMDFAEKKQLLEITILRYQKKIGAISFDEYRKKSREIRLGLNPQKELDEFENDFSELQKDIYAPKKQREQTLQILSDMKEHKDEIRNYQGKEQTVTDIFLNHIAQRIAENSLRTDNLRKMAPAFQDLPDYGIEQIEDLQGYIKKQLTTVFVENLEDLLKSGKREIVIPTTNGKGIPLPIQGIEMLIGEIRT